MVSNPSRRAGIALLLVVSCSALGLSADPLEDAAARAGKEPRELVALGELYVESRRFVEARKAFQTALGDPLERGKALLGLARVEITAGSLEQAKRSCRELKRKDDSGLAETCEGELWLSAGRISRAVAQFRAAIKKGASAHGKLGLADALRRQGDYEAALAAYDEAAAAGAGYRAALGRGLVLEAQKNNDEALAAYESALRVQPASSDAHYLVGRLLRPGPRAVAELRTATALRPGWFEGLSALGGVLLVEGDHADALIVFKEAEKAGGGGAKGAVSFGQAQALSALGRLEEAEAALKKTIEAVPSHGDALLKLARLYFERRKFDEALEAVEKARAAMPEEVSVYLAAGEIYHQIGRDTAATSFLKHAVALDSRASRAHALLGDIACSRGLYADGKGAYRTALEGDMAELTPAQIEQKIAACRRKEKK